MIADICVRMQKDSLTLLADVYCSLTKALFLLKDQAPKSRPDFGKVSYTVQTADLQL